jgi:hypothetical protein
MRHDGRVGRQLRRGNTYGITGTREALERLGILDACLQFHRDGQFLTVREIAVTHRLPDLARTLSFLVWSEAARMRRAATTDCPDLTDHPA